MWIIVLLQWLLASDALQSVIGVEMNFWRSANDVSLFLLPRPGRCAQRQRPSVIRFTMTWKVSRDTCEEARPNRPRKQMRNKNIAIHFLKICSYLIVHVSGDNNFLYGNLMLHLLHVWGARASASSHWLIAGFDILSIFSTQMNVLRTETTSTRWE